MENSPNLICPYTGNLMEVAHRDDLRSPGFYLKGGFDPELPFLTEEDAIKALRMRKGKADAVTRLVCPYTGKALKVVHRNGVGLWQIVGEFFSPNFPYQFEEDILYNASFRGGKKPKYEKPERETVRIIENFADQSNPAEGLGGTSDEIEHGIAMLSGD